MWMDLRIIKWKMSDTKEYDLIYMNYKMGEKSIIVRISRLAGEINCRVCPREIPWRGDDYTGLYICQNIKLYTYNLFCVNYVSLRNEYWKICPKMIVIPATVKFNNCSQLIFWQFLNLQKSWNGCISFLWKL